jgi:uncharacterized membrane protein (UPF0136 family)
MLHTLAIGLAAGYGALSLTGGLMGYLKAKSRASLIAGGVSGLVLLGSAFLAASHPVAGLSIASVVSAALVARFAKAVMAKRPKPIAYVMVGGGVAVLIASGLALI